MSNLLAAACFREEREWGYKMRECQGVLHVSHGGYKVLYRKTENPLVEIQRN